MGIVFRQSLKASIVSYFGTGIGAFSVIFLFPKCLTAEQIGLTRVLLEAAMFFSFFSQLGASNITLKFFPYFRDYSKNHNGFFLIISSLPLIGFLIFLILYISFRTTLVQPFIEKSKLLTDYYLYIIPLTFFCVYIAISEAYSSMLLRIVVPRIVKEVFVRIFLVFITLLLFFKILDIHEYVFLFVLIYGLAFLMDILYINKIQPISFKPNFSFLNKPLIKEMGLFMLYMIIAGSGSSIANKIDIGMITSKISLSGTGIYSIAFFVAAFIEVPTRSIFQITTPFAIEALKNNEHEKLDSLYKRVALNQFVIAGFLFLLIWINVNNLYKIMPHGDLYSTGKYVIFFIGLSKVFDAATGINASILNYSKYYYYTLYFIFILAALAFFNNLVFIKMYGITGAAIATAISIFLYNLILVIFVKLKLKTHPISFKTLIVLVIFIIIFYINTLIPNFHNAFIDAAIRSIIISGLFSFLILKFKISSDINLTIHNLWNKYILNKS
jgi:O-antigen/teichoic acid export membrane protein